MERVFQSRWFHAGVSALIVVLVFIVYSNTFNASFHFDDTPQIVENYALRDLGNLGEILLGNRGVTMATFALNYAAGGLDVTGYHLVNTLIHVANGILAYFVVLLTLRRLSGEELWARKIAAFSALLFSVHPIQTQAVTYIVQRMETLASFFYLLAVLLFIKAVSTEKFALRGLLYAAIVFCFILGFKSKEIAITLPAALILFDYFFIGRGSIGETIKRWPVYLPLGVLLIYFAVSTIVPLGGFGDLSAESSGALSGAGGVDASPVETATTGGEVEPSAGFGVSSISPSEYLLTQFNVIVYYIALLFVPINQNLDYDFPLATNGLFGMPEVGKGAVLNLPAWPPVVSLVILLAIIAVAVYLFIRSRRAEGSPRALVVSFFIFWFFILLSPTSSFIPIIDVIYEHRVYLASLGFFVVFATCLDWLFCRPWGGDKSGQQQQEE